MSDQGTDNDTMFNTGTQSSNNEPTNNIPEFLKDLVGQGKKYATLEDALKSIPAAQAHIEKLEGEAANARLTEEQQKEREQQLLADLEEKLLSKMKNQATPDEPSTPATPQPVDDQSSGVDLDEVVTRVVEQREQKKSAAINQQSVVQAAISKWGASAEQTLYSKAAELGMSPQEIDQISATNPKAAFRLLGIDGSVQNQPQSMNFNSTLNTQSGTTDTVPMPDMPASFDMWGSDDYLTEHIRKIEAHLVSTGEIPNPEN